MPKMEMKRKIPYIGPRGHEEMEKIRGHSLTARCPHPSLQMQNDMTINHMNSKIKSFGFDAP